jgi:hypothetical protein
MLWWRAPNILARAQISILRYDGRLPHLFVVLHFSAYISSLRGVWALSPVVVPSNGTFIIGK